MPSETSLIRTTTSKPSRIQAAPSPNTIRVWNGDHFRRSRRARIVDLIGRFATAATPVLMPNSFARAWFPVGPKSETESGFLDDHDLRCRVPVLHHPLWMTQA